jgi:hypothetical protein
VQIVDLGDPVMPGEGHLHFPQVDVFGVDSMRMSAASNTSLNLAMTISMALMHPASGSNQNQPLNNMAHPGAMAASEPSESAARWRNADLRLRPRLRAGKRMTTPNRLTKRPNPAMTRRGRLLISGGCEKRW